MPAPRSASRRRSAAAACTPRPAPTSSSSRARRARRRWRDRQGGIGRPLLANMVEGGRTPILPASGCRRSATPSRSTPRVGFLAVAAALERVYAHLKQHGDSTAIGESLRLQAHDGADGLPGGLGVREPLGAVRSGKARNGTQVKALVFDVFGTVVDWRSGVARDAAPSCASTAAATSTRAPSPMPGASATSPRWRNAAPAAGPSRASTCCTGRTWTWCCATTASTRRRSARPSWTASTSPGTASIPGPTPSRACTRLKREVHHRARCRTATSRCWLNMAKRAGIPWDAILGAEVAQAYKPQPEAYLRTAEMLVIRPERALPGRRAQWRPQGGAGLRAGDRLRRPPDGARAGPGDRPRAVRGLGRGGERLPGPRRETRLLIRAKPVP